MTALDRWNLCYLWSNGSRIWSLDSQRGGQSGSVVEPAADVVTQGLPAERVSEFPRVYTADFTNSADRTGRRSACPNEKSDPADLNSEAGKIVKAGDDRA